MPDELIEVDESGTATLVWFLWIARAEGVSLLALFGVAMPLKYGLGWMHATAWAGWFHGALFLVYLIALGSVVRVRGWGFLGLALGFIGSLVPLGTFAFERWAERSARV